MNRVGAPGEAGMGWDNGPMHPWPYVHLGESLDLLLPVCQMGQCYLPWRILVKTKLESMSLAQCWNIMGAQTNMGVNNNREPAMHVQGVSDTIRKGPKILSSGCLEPYLLRHSAWHTVGM